MKEQASCQEAVPRAFVLSRCAQSDFSCSFLGIAARSHRLPEIAIASQLELVYIARQYRKRAISQEI